MFDYWTNDDVLEVRRKAKEALAHESKLGPDDGCFYCRFNSFNRVCLLTGYDIAHQTGPACARFREK